MASGTAVIATETAGAKELLGEEGIFVPVKDPIALSEQLCGLLANEEKRRALGARCREMAAQKFSLERMLSETEKLYEAVLRS
jgi:glycosyltransferase involved in cell wall biosynthesis